MSAFVLRALAWISLAIIVVLTLVPPEFRPVTGLTRAFEHSAIFFITGALFVFGYQIRIGLFFILAIIVCGFLELLQAYAPGRHARLTDAMVDAMSACIGIAIAWGVLRLRQTSKREKRIHVPD